MTVWAWAAAGALGAVGAVARFVIDGGIGRRVRGDMPWGTLTVNLIGALAVGILVSAGLDGEGRFLVVTFSTWIFETQRLAEEGEARLATLNIVVSVILGLAGVALGWWIGSLL
jgi:fluoride exporter